MQAMNALAEIIHDEAARRGVLPFARFMELALYHPALGYYEKPGHSPGRRGDFYTSVSTGELFGQLLACQFAGWLEAEGGNQKSEVRIVEAGAHDGKLAADILDWLRIHRPKLFDQIEYGIIEPSDRRQEWQRETLKGFSNVRWFSRFDDSTIQRFNGIIFSNELLDAFPIHRYAWDAGNKKWFEWGVAVEGEKFIWARLENSELPSSIINLPSSLLAVLPDGYTIEASPAAETWWREAAGALARGKLLAIDYGLTADEMFSPTRTRGTLRAYFRHHVTDDLLVNPGEQDLTAHVNFSAIQNAGEHAGLTTEFFGSQAKFLVDILATAEKNKTFGELVASKRSEGGWNAKQTRQFQTLTHPEHLGRAFRVLIQSR
jgi:SAM-dependent MidA family methyltransferase